MSDIAAHITEYLFYRRKNYILLEPRGLFALKALGLKFARPPKQGQVVARCTYAIYNGQLALDVFDTDSPLSYSGIKKWFKATPPAINGVLPDQQDAVYTNIGLPLVHTGKIRLANPLEGNREVHYTLHLDKGKLIKAEQNSAADKIISFCPDDKQDKDVRAIAASLQPIATTTEGTLYEGTGNSHWFAYADNPQLVYRIKQEHVPFFRSWNTIELAPGLLSTFMEAAAHPSNAAQADDCRAIKAYVTLQDGNIGYGEVLLCKRPPTDLPDDCTVYTVNDLKTLLPVIPPDPTAVAAQVEWPIPTISGSVVVIGRC